MGTSGDPRKRATTKKTAAKKTSAKKAPAKKTASAISGPSDVSAFKQRLEGTLLPLPTGLVVKAKRIELQTLIARGEVPNPLMDVVSEAIEKGRSVDVAEMVGVEEGEIDLDAVRNMFEMVNEVVVTSVLSPKVHPEPEEGEERDDDLLYVNEIDEVDKMFIFQWALGGTSDLDRFREEATADMASLAEIQGTRATPKRTNRS